MLTALLYLYCLAAFLYWLRMLGAAWLTLRRVPRIAQLPSPVPPQWPSLSIVVPACNEAEDFEQAARSLLNEDYPDLQIIFVDDRSTDETGPLMDRIARSDPRVKVIHLTKLPKGWLGKVHALDCGYQKTTGKYVLFTDADIQFAPGTLRKVIAWMEAQRLDHVAAFPEDIPLRFPLTAVILSFVRQFIAFVRPWAVPDPRSTASVGVGAFNMVRRAAFEKTKGFEWIRMEVADDMGLGHMMKRSGARCAVFAAFGDISLYWYRTFAAAARGSEKAYAVFNCRPLLMIAAGLAMSALEIAPCLLPLSLAAPSLRPIGLSGLFILAPFLAANLVINRWVGGGRLLAGLAAPLFAPALAYGTIRAALLGWRRNGVLWRGVLYDAQTLRQGARYPFPGRKLPD